MNKKLEVTFRDGEVLEFEEGTTFKTISEHFQKYYKYDILVAKVDNEIVDLNNKLTKNCKIDFFDRSSELGNSTYSRTLRLMLVYAVFNLYEHKAKMTIQFSMDNGFYCTIDNMDITTEELDKITTELNRIKESNYEIEKTTVSRLDAIKYLNMYGKTDKVNMLKYISNTYISLYRIGEYYDYFYGRMAYSTGQINSFKLNYINSNGFVLSFPTLKEPERTRDYVHYEKLFNKFIEYTKWSNKAYIKNAADLNFVVSQAKSVELINIVEAFYNNQIFMASEEIYKKKDTVKIVLIAGPSSSGKTTTAKKLDIYLKTKGFHTYPIEVDNYYLDIDKRAKDENGELDFESLDAIDVDLFNDNLSRLLKGEEVELPKYNFVKGKREYNGNVLKLGSNDIIIIEGLHALNDKLTASIDQSKKYKIYISPLVTINLDDYNYVHTTDVRKLRRIVRDSKTRGYNASETLNRWSSISAGEYQNIFGFQETADAIINSTLLYEMGILKTYAEPLLFNMSEDDPQYPEAMRLINILRNFLPIPSDDVPKDSILREFIGGSCFED